MRLRGALLASVCFRWYWLRAPIRRGRRAARRSWARSRRPRKARWKACWSAPRRTARPSPPRWSPTRRAVTASPPGARARQYTIRIRAVGYELDGKAAADRPGRHGQRRPQAQEDPQSLLPAHQCGMDREPAGHAGAEGRIRQLRELPHGRADRRSKHDADEFVQVRAHGELRQPELPNHPQAARRAQLEERGARRGPARLRRIPRRDQSEQSDTWAYPLKTLPRPTGASTVIITEYDLPRTSSSRTT